MVRATTGSLSVPYKYSTALAALWLALILTLAVFPDPVASATAISISATPHDSYSSSIGVLGCKINTNRVAYWPMAVDCTNICVKVTYASRSVYLLRIDQSGGAYDMSYDAWNYLQTGKSASTDPIAGGGVSMTYEDASPSNCKNLIQTDGLPLSAANSMDFLFSCLEQPDSWVGQNHILYNIDDSVCSLGYDEKCSLDWQAGANQPTCPHQLGLQTPLSSSPVYNIRYPTGQKVSATTGQTVNSGANSGAARLTGRLGNLRAVVASGIIISTGLPIMRLLF